MKMLALLILSEAYDGESVSCFSPSFLGFAPSLAFLLKLLPPNDIPPKSKTGWGSFM